MKRTVLFMLAVLLTLQFAGCGCQKAPDPTEPSGSVDSAVIAPQVTANSVPAKLWAQFQQEITKNANVTALELANALVAIVSDQFAGEATQLEKNTEYFAGFDNYQITGYRACAMYGPVIGSIAFVGYVFELEDGTDPAAFVKGLTENCNPRWNICVSAEQTACGAIGNRVFFVMCP